MPKLHYTLLGERADIFICHGILGSGSNWRTFARLLQSAHPNRGIALIDLRNHGSSPAGQPPHTIEACANDLIELTAELGVPKIIIGHSFGGKVALCYAHKTRPLQAWILDSPPGTLAEKPTDQSQVLEVIEALAKVPLPLQHRRDLVDILTQQGFTKAIAQWLTTNLKRGADGFIFRFSLPVIRELINDYFGYDGWPILEQPKSDIHVVRAQDSDRWSTHSLARLATLDRQQVHVLPQAGHWVHVDNPKGLYNILNRYFPPSV